MKKVFVLCAMALFVVGKSTAYATSMGTTSQNGDLFSGSYVPATDSMDHNNDAYLVTLTVNTSGHTLASGDYFNAAAITLGGPFDGASLSSVTYSPGVNETGGWTYMSGGTSNSGTGCNGKGNPFNCAQYTSGTKAFDNGGTYSWTWLIDGPTIDPTGFHVKAIWVNADGTFVDQISNDFSGGSDGRNPPPPSVPEPASMTLLGSGLVTAAVKLRRKLS